MIMVGEEGLLVRLSDASENAGRGFRGWRSPAPEPLSANGTPQPGAPVLDVELVRGFRAEHDASFRCIVRLRSGTGWDLFSHHQAPTPGAAVQGALGGLVPGLESVAARRADDGEAATLRRFLTACDRFQPWISLPKRRNRQRVRLSAV